jgi:acyl-[acyl-carrier-protein]-phospholipid O-acyltransferase/long-chain-fatty-acid--[acyl-carrier-protein] ligase
MDSKNDSSAPVLVVPPPSADPEHWSIPRPLRRSFRHFVCTQFLGAFNDNAFKQLMLLLAVSRTGDPEGGTDQALALLAFSAPFILFSGIAGSLADRYPKTRIIVIAKYAEIAIMALAVPGFLIGSFEFLLPILFLMATQSAFFGPAKYGYLPEALPAASLPRANGTVLMTTFIAIILGQGAAGLLKQGAGDDLLWPSLLFVVLAVAGTWTATRITPLPSAGPELPLRWPWGDLGPSLRWMWRSRTFRSVVLANSWFWFLGAVTQPWVNDYGKRLMKLSDAHTSFLLVSLSAGMAVGGVLAGRWARGRVDFRHSLAGAIGVAVGIGMLTFAHASYLFAHVVFLSIGIAGSVFGLPFQIWIQREAEVDAKGRAVAAANFANWVLIFASAGYYWIASLVLPIEAIGAPLAPLTVIVAVWLVRRVPADAVASPGPRVG